MITTILQYSTLDYRFLNANLYRLSKFSNEIIIPVCDHFFNGENENQELLNKTFEIVKQYPNTKIYFFSWEGEKNTPNYYHNLSRKIGTELSTNKWLLFLDGDEVVDDNFWNWFYSVQHLDQTFWLTCHWYFREPVYRATKTESAGLVIRKKYCNWNLDTNQERQQFFNLPNFKNGNNETIGYEDKPVIHHFSWVRSKDEMLQKVNSWGHRFDRDWGKLVEEEFTRPFNGTDFVHGYNYDVVKNEFNL
jgi:hypothetical protein